MGLVRRRRVASDREEERVGRRRGEKEREGGVVGRAKCEELTPSSSWPEFLGIQG